MVFALPHPQVRDLLKGFKHLCTSSCPNLIAIFHCISRHA
nr:MAG TPA: hypothetical protein [Caudoviricetes sp.]